MIVSLAHVAIHVSDVEAALDFYCKQLGLVEAFRLNHPDGSVWIVYLKVGNGTFIELFPGGDPELRAPAHGVGLKHFCLQVDDVARTVEEWRERGLEPVHGPTVGRDNAALAWYQDPDGNGFEIQQYLPGAQQLKKG